MTEKRYQVFVSSTSKDLEPERRLVIDALLESSYIPVGMELFNAATESAWPVIERLIDNCDYYIVIVAGRYGTEREGTGKSFTQAEYEYARQIGKPRLAFLYRDLENVPIKFAEPTEAGMRKIKQFRSMLEGELLCKYWMRSGDELAGKVVSSLNSAVLSNPQPGWVRGDSLEAIASEIRANLVIPAQSVGIARISPDGQAGPIMSERMAQAHSIAIMSTSASRLIEIQKTYIVEALSRGCSVRVLVPELEGTFVGDVEESESEDTLRDSISNEIRIVKIRLREAKGEANRLGARHGTNIGSVRLGHFTTHLRSTLVLCDDVWGWLTITLPPARAPQTPSFELINKGNHTLLEACLRHFDRTWTIVEEREGTEEI